MFEAEDSGLRGWRGEGIRLLRVFFTAGIEFRRNHCWERAATLSFVTIVSLIPLAVVFLSFMGLAWSDGNLKGFVQDKLLYFLAPDEKDLRDSIWKILNDQINATAFQFKIGVNIIAAVGLVVAAAALLVSAERQFNRLWDVTVARNYFQKLRIFWIILTTSPFALGGSLYVDQFTSTGTLIGALKSQYTAIDILYSFLIPGLVSFVAFTILNILLPNTRVRLKHAALGALVSAILWEAAKKGFYLYINQAHNYGKFYGSLGILPVFLVWIYITWAIILLGAEVVRSSQHLRQLSRSKKGRTARFHPPAPYLGLYLLDRIYRAFNVGLAHPDIEKVAEEAEVGTEQLESIARRLVGAGFLIEDRRNTGSYVPARPPDLVRIRDLVEVFPEDFLLLEELPGAGGRETGGRVFQLFDGARRAFLDSFGDRTLRDLQVKNQHGDTETHRS